jgi:dihydromethanopterin reductase
MAGPRTIGAVPPFAHADRTLVTLRSGDDPQAMLDRFSGRIVYVGGPADRWFDPRWPLASMSRWL